MLQKLTIKNFALLPYLELELGGNLNILSGETGAGKSIIVDCIMLLMGGRYDKTMLRYGESFGYVEGVFSLADSLRDAFSEYLCDGDDCLIIRRRFTAEGKNEIRVNGNTVTVSMLKAVSGLLVDVCGQNEHQSLSAVGNHIKIIDFFARDKMQDVARSLEAKYAALQQVKQRMSELGDSKQRLKDLDTCKYRLEEIEEVAVKDGEEEELVAKRKRLAGAEKIASSLSAASEILSSAEPSVSELLAEVRDSISKVSEYDEKYVEWEERVRAAIIELDDIGDDVASELDELDFSPDEYDKIERRLSDVRQLTRKYGGYAGIEAARDEYRKQIDEAENADAIYDGLSREYGALLEESYALAVKLSEIRRQAATELKNAVESELAELNMEHSVFEARFEELPSAEDCEARLTESGMDRVEFYLSPNVGQPLKPLVKIISGGELSRLMLALRVLLSKIDSTPTVVFDEIDTGISGKVGQEIAKKLARLSKDKQLLCVTHLPQIASMADEHFFIDKYVSDGQTCTRVERLSRERQIEEIARLSGAQNISAHSEENAEQMKIWSDKYKSSIS